MTIDLSTDIATDRTNPWLVDLEEPATTAAAGRGEAADHERLPLPLVSAHGGAGTSTWARLLNATEVGGRASAPAGGGMFVIVTRGSVAGIAAAKAILHDHAPSVRAVLLVPAAPGRRPRRLVQELKILRGAVRVVEVTWRPDFLLRRPTEITPDLLPERERRRLLTELSPLNTEEG